MILPPGTLLQHMYARERVRTLRPGRFVEVGVGGGALSRLLLELGWHGTAFDVNADAVARARELNAEAVERGSYDVRHEDWLTAPEGDPSDLVISSMVIEHLSDEDEARYFERCRAWLRPDGLAIVLVPASPAHWGIEDETAGHVRRYSTDALRRRLDELGWSVSHSAGLTYPLSNLLLPLSNLLVRRAEGEKRTLTLDERTRVSGVRDVPLKTRLPAAFGLVLNPYVLYPLHLLQKATRANENALVLYAECRPRAVQAPPMSERPAVEHGARRG